MPQMNERNDGVGLAIGRARQTNAGRKFPPLKFGRWLLGCGRSGAPARFVARSGRNGVRGQGGCGACLLAIRLSQRRSLDRLLHRPTTVNVRCVSYRLKDRRKAGFGATTRHIPRWPTGRRSWLRGHRAAGIRFFGLHMLGNTRGVRVSEPPQEFC